MKKIMNEAENMVQEMCNGLVLSNPELYLNQKYKIIRKANINTGKVSLISGGGSGHEPAHAGYVGKGMLDAAVCGDVFASPSQIQVYQAIRETRSEKGTLLIIKNYSGDIMNFKNAAALAEGEAEVDYVVVNDDIAVKDSLYTVGRRGVAGTVLVHKIAGAAAERGMELAEVKAAAEKAIRNVRSIGFALSSCTVPAKGTPTFGMEEGEMEYGVGIHGEPGVRREKVLPARKLAERMIGELLQEMEAEASDEVTLLVNGFGGTPLQELYVLNNDCCRVLKEKGIQIYRIFVGNYMTSIDMQGASVSLMKMDEQLKELLDQPCFAPAFRVDGNVGKSEYMAGKSKKDGTEETEEVYEDLEEPAASKIVDDIVTVANMKYFVDRMGTFIIQNEVSFCELDSHAGDGDFGMSVAKGFRRLKKEWNEIIDKSENDIGDFLCDCAMVIMEHCGGASGPIWGSAFLEAGKLTRGKRQLKTVEFAQMLTAALTGIRKTGERSFGRGAVVGDKTLVDALEPCADSWNRLSAEGADMGSCFAAGARAAVEGARATEKMVARMGRAGTVGERSLGYPDAGAYAVGAIFSDLAEKVTG